DPVEFARPLIMAIVNATPDSFSGDGLFRRPDEAVAQGLKMVEQGADIIDIGGESTRPGAKPVTVDEELERVVPTIEGLSQCGKPISIDSRNAAVMNAALDAGAAIINDISALSHDPEALAVAAASGAPVMIMHCQGLPGTMQNDPHYDDVVLDVYDYLDGRIGACLAAGIERGNIIVDPGIGFGKTARHNFELLQSLSLFHGLGCPILLGVSRKRFITAPGARFNAREGVGGSLAAALDGLAQGAHILRVHDVAETVRAGKIWGAIADSG
ncbi:MAG: dihydropteroate synthase, partial [Sphingomonadales bacterium]